MKTQYYRNNVEIESIEEDSLWTRQEVEGIDSAVLVDDDQHLVVQFTEENFYPVEVV